MLKGNSDIVQELALTIPVKPVIKGSGEDSSVNRRKFERENI